MLLKLTHRRVRRWQSRDKTRALWRLLPKKSARGTLAIQSDAGKVAEIEATMKKIKERFGRIDALFVNAGVGQFVPFEQITEKFFDGTVNINTKGVFFTVQKEIP